MSASSSVAPLRQRAAILFADVHGYSKLMDRDELGTCERIIRSIRLIRSLIGDYGGCVVQTSGDGVLALFDESCQALRFAVDVQREFRNDAVWNADGNPIAFRIGLNEGDVLVGDAGIQGNSINIAARIQAMAKPGGICISAAVRAAAGGVAGLTMHALGPKKLKNITDPIEIFAIELDDEPSASPLEVTPQGETVALEPEQASVVVLPLDNLAGDPSDHHLCLGIASDISTNLSRFRDLAVIANHSALVIKRQDLSPHQLCEKLGIRYMMNGTVQRLGGKIRLRIELTDVTTQLVIWSDRFSGDLGDIFGFQDDVTDIVAARLAIQIADAERRRLAQLRSPDFRAYGLVLRGQALQAKLRRESNLHARRLFEQATEIEPKFGRGYAGMSRTFNLDWRYAWSNNPEQSLNKAVELAKAAIDYDRHDARGYAELGYAQLYKKRHDESLSAYERAYQLNPNDADLLAEMGDSLVYSRHTKRAVELLEWAIRLNPYHPDWYLWYLGDAYFCLADYQKTIDVLKKMRNQSEAHRLLASSYALLGDLENARLHGKQLMKVHPNFSIDHWKNVPPSKFPEDLDVFFEGLRMAGLH